MSVDRHLSDTEEVAARRGRRRRRGKREPVASEGETDRPDEERAWRWHLLRRLPLRRLAGELRPLGPPAVTYLASRVVTLAAMGIAAIMHEGLSFGQTFTRWDGKWYLDAALSGYSSRIPEIQGRAVYSNVPFFPLFPGLIRASSEVTGISHFRSAVMLGLLFGLLATLLLWVLCRRLKDADVANRAVALFCFFPGSFVMSMVYAEPLMLTLVMCCFLALLARRWLLSGLASALATASRPNAVVLVPCCVWAAARAIRDRREWGAIAAPLLAPAGIIAFFLFLWRRTGEPAAWFRVQREAWNEHFDFGVTSAERLWRVLKNPLGDVNSLLAAAGLAFVVLAGVFLVRSRLPAIFHIYTAGVLFLAMGSSVLGARPRFVWTAFPLFIALAQRLREVTLTVVLGVLAALLTALTILSVVSQGMPLRLEAIP
jgi:hypothetical protein